MAQASLSQLLASSTIVKVVSTIKTPLSKLQNFFGMQIGGPNTRQIGGTTAGWDIFDMTRNIATGRAIGSGPASRRPQAVGRVDTAFYRAHEKIPILAANVHRTRPLGGQYGAENVEPGGQSYITRQEAHLARLFANNREILVAGMIRGEIQVLISGDDLIPVFSGGHYTVDFQVPAGNKNQLNMTGGGNIITADWATASTAILDDLHQINAAFEELHGYPLRHAWCNSTTIAAVYNNTQMQTVAGTSNVVFNSFNPTGMRGPDGVEDTGFEVVFRAAPWLTWHVYDGGLNVNGTFTKFFPDDNVGFYPDPSPAIAEWLEGSEWVKESVVDGGSERFGFTGWTEGTTQPAGWELIGLDVGIPALYIPKAVAFANVNVP